MDTARTLEEKRERVLEQMRAIRSMRPGSVTEQYLKVTHKGKRKPVMRGPYWVYTRKEAGKTVGQRLSREDAEQVTKDIEAHRKFVALCKEFETLTMRLGDVEVDAVLAPEKNGRDRGRAGPRGRTHPGASSPREACRFGGLGKFLEGSRSVSWRQGSSQSARWGGLWPARRSDSLQLWCPDGEPRLEVEAAFDDSRPGGLQTFGCNSHTDTDHRQLRIGTTLSRAVTSAL